MVFSIQLPFWPSHLLSQVISNFTYPISNSLLFILANVFVPHPPTSWEVLIVDKAFVIMSGLQYPLKNCYCCWWLWRSLKIKAWWSFPRSLSSQKLNSTSLFFSWTWVPGLVYSRVLLILTLKQFRHLSLLSRSTFTITPWSQRNNLFLLLFN